MVSTSCSHSLEGIFIKMVAFLVFRLITSNSSSLLLTLENENLVFNLTFSLSIIHGWDSNFLVLFFTVKSPVSADKALFSAKSKESTEFLKNF